MIKNITKFIILTSILLMLVMPVLSLAAENPDAGLVPCGKADATGVIRNNCDFEDFMVLINNVINFILFALALPIAAIMFAYAGVLLVTSGGSTENRSKAKSIFTNAIIGLILSAAAWLIVKTILSILGYDGAWIGF